MSNNTWGNHSIYRLISLRCLVTMISPSTYASSSPTLWVCCCGVVLLLYLDYHPIRKANLTLIISTHPPPSPSLPPSPPLSPPPPPPSQHPQLPPPPPTTYLSENPPILLDFITCLDKSK